MRPVIYIRLFDLHCDTLTNGWREGCSIAQNKGAIDLYRGGRYSSWVQSFAAFIPDGLTREEAQCHCSELLDVAERWEREQPSDFRIVRSRADLAYKRCTCRALLTGENIGALGDIHWVDHLRERGVWMATLTWNGDNPWGSGCFGAPSGLTSLGRCAVERMVALGMTVDVSHLNECGFWEILRMGHPVVTSHSNAAAVTPHPRNLTDAQFGAVRDSGGLVGLNLYHPHLGAAHNESCFDAFYRHLTHFLSLDGERTVCIGTDLDGMEIPLSYDGISVLDRLYDDLLSRGVPSALLEQVFYTNAYRFFTNAIA